MELPQDQTKAVSQIRQWTIDRLRSLREAAGFSQADIANKMSVHFSRVGDFESNRSDYKASTVFRYVRAMGIRMDRVFIGAPEWRGAHTTQVIVIGKDEAIQRLVSLGYSSADALEAVDILLR
jgi:transcriptional regulator with XRE-family HTH domain